MKRSNLILNPCNRTADSATTRQPSGAILSPPAAALRKTTDSKRTPNDRPFMRKQFAALFLLISIAASAQETIETVDNYIINSQFGKAIEFIEQQCDSSKEILSRKAYCYAQSGNYPQSIGVLTVLLDRFPSDSRFKIRKADLLSKTNQTDSAKYYYSEVLTDNPDDFDTAIKLIKLNINQQDYPSASRDLETLIAKDSLHVQANLLHACCHYLSNRYDEAVAGFNKCLALGDSSLFLNKNLGLSYYCLEDYENSLPFLTKAFEQDTTNNNVLFALASANRELQNYPEAIALFERLTERLRPAKEAMFVYYKKFAETCYDSGDYLAAVANYKESLNYAESVNRIVPLFKISDIYSVNLEDYSSSLNYYKQYRQSLIDYQQSVSSADSMTVDDLLRRIANIDEHLEYIETQIEKGK